MLKLSQLFSTLISLVGSARSAPSRSLTRNRSLCLESLESRNLLSITVNTAMDEWDGNIIGGDDVSLRDAVIQALPNETINFATSLNGATIALKTFDPVTGQSLGEIAIAKNLTIDASSLSNGITIDAGALADPTPTVKNGDGMRIFNISGGNVTLKKLTLTGGDVFAGGGAIQASLSTGNSSLTLDEMTLINNHTQTSGGGLYAQVQDSATILITNSQILNNSAVSDGGGIYTRAYEGNPALMARPEEVKIVNSLISGNTAGYRGGGLYSRGFQGTETLVEETRVTDNHVPANGPLDAYSKQNGGGIYAYTWGISGVTTNKPRFTITRSTVDNNDAYNQGGGVFVCSKFNGEFVAMNSTFSNNETTFTTTVTTNTIHGRGGGLRIARFGFENTPGEAVDAYLVNVTITQNVSRIAGGIDSANLDNVRTRMYNSIVSQNYTTPAKTTQSNFVGRATSLQYNLYGTGSIFLNSIGGAGSPGIAPIIRDDPKLGPLTDNGGPTPTHALLVGSDAIDHANNLLSRHPLTLVATANDQRGLGFAREYDVVGVGNNSNQAIIDMGAFEVGALKVTNVTIKSSNPTVNPTLHPPVSFNGPNDATDLDGSGAQLRTIPIAKIDTVTITFSHNLQSLASGAMKLLGLKTNVEKLPVSVDFIAGTNTATWKFTELDSDQYVILLSDVVADPWGSQLDGEWTNPGRVFAVVDDPLNPSSITDGGVPVYYQNSSISKFPSGNGASGGAFKFVFTVLNADASLNNIVNVTDLGVLATFYSTPGAYGFTQADFSGDGSVTVTDLGLLGTYYGFNFRELMIGDINKDGMVTNADLTEWNTMTDPLFLNLRDINNDGVADNLDTAIIINQIARELAFEWIGS